MINVASNIGFKRYYITFNLLPNISNREDCTIWSFMYLYIFRMIYCWCIITFFIHIAILYHCIITSFGYFIPVKYTNNLFWKKEFPFLIMISFEAFFMIIMHCYIFF